MSLAMKARQKAKRKGTSKDRVFGCDLVEHLQLSGQDVPQVLKSCTEFVEEHGIVDGIYRLSGVSSNIQKLRLEFDTDRSPDLNKELYLQDIHCVSSLCKAYFRELPNPLLTYQLYDKFADAVAIQMEEGRLVKIKEVLKELPPPHYRTLEFLMRHLVHMASYSPKTNMHVRNLAIVWAPNLLRSKDIEMSGFNGTAAFMEVRIQSIVVEFILTHVEQLFGDAPLTAGSRESIRKSLLLMESSPMVLADEKYCFSYNVPATLNQGDGPPQMRPYHTIIELTDSKKKGSLKAKKWRSIFNLGRASNDAKRRSGKMEDKDDKATKMRLRPAKSMDSLSSMPCTSEDDVHLGRKKSQKQLLRCRESFDGPASLDSSFLESDEYPEKVKGEERQGESEGEATAKSEPTTPKVSRSSLVGVAPQGRSPKTGRNRAEKCAGVHISGPFNVTVPFHITSNLSLSRLTRGLECPALSYCSLENEAPESSLAKEEEAASKEKDTEPKLMSTATTNKDDPTEENIESLPVSEENWISMEVQDSFSFLDSPDAWLGDGLDGDYPWKSSHTAFGRRGSEADGFPVPEDDLGSGFMNEMIGGGMQLEMFSAVPPMDYLSIEECMNEHSEEEEDQYYLATGCLEVEELSKEVDPEEVYVSAFDDLSPLAAELEHLQGVADQVPGALPPEGTVEDQPFSLIGEISPGDPAGSHRLEAGLETQPGVFPACDPDLANSSSLNPEVTSLSEEEEGVPLNSNFHELDAVVKDEAEPVKEEPNLCLRQGQSADAGARDDLLLQLERLLEEGRPDAVPEKTHESLAPGYDKQITQPSLEDVWPLHQSAPDLEQVHWSSCEPSIGAEDSTPETVRTFDEQVDCGFPSQEAEPLRSGEVLYPPPTTEASSSTEGSTLPGAELHHVSSLLGNDSETASSESSLMPAPWLVPSPAQGALPGAALPRGPLPDGCSDSNALLLLASSPNSCPGSPARKPLQAPPADASKQVLSDGSVRMKLSANTTRIQQVKSFPVVPPKPQFAKTPPFLTPKTPTEEAPLMWPDPPAPDENGGTGTKEESGESSLPPKPPRPLSLDTYCSTQGGDTSAEILPAPSEMPASPDPCCSRSDDLQKQRNSMPVSLEKYGWDCDGRGDAGPKPLDKYGPRFKSGNVNANDLQPRKGSLPESFETDSSSTRKSGGGKGESPQKQLLPLGPRLLAKHSGEGSGVAPQKQRQTTWRNGSSMSFDEAVALAKERHLTQAPVRRMQTYCCGDVEGPLSPFKMEKPPPHPKPALKPLGQRPLRPLSCLGTAAPPEALVSGKLFFSQASPDVALEGHLSPTHESPSFPQDLSPRRRLSLPKIGRRLSLSEEAPGAMPQEQRIPPRVPSGIEPCKRQLPRKSAKVRRYSSEALQKGPD